MILVEELDFECIILENKNKISRTKCLSSY